MTFEDISEKSGISTVIIVEDSKQ